MLVETPAIILHVTPHGESGARVSVFSREAGRVSGLMKGIRRKQAEIQIGTAGQLTWRRRLENQLGTFTWEGGHSPAAAALTSLPSLLCVQYVTEMLALSLPEEHAYPHFYTVTEAFLKTLSQPNLAVRLALWEVQLLTTLGYALSLRKEEAVPCTSGTPLTYVSPKTGRAVTAAMGEPYADKLLTLPHIFGGPHAAEEVDAQAAFKLTGYFIQQALHGKLSNIRADCVTALVEQTKTAA